VGKHTPYPDPPPGWEENEGGNEGEQLDDTLRTIDAEVVGRRPPLIEGYWYTAPFKAGNTTQINPGVLWLHPMWMPAVELRLAIRTSGGTPGATTGGGAAIVLMDLAGDLIDDYSVDATVENDFSEISAPIVGPGAYVLAGLLLTGTWTQNPTLVIIQNPLGGPAAPWNHTEETGFTFFDLGAGVPSSVNLQSPGDRHSSGPAIYMRLVDP